MNALEDKASAEAKDIDLELAIIKAVRQLTRSERGRQALKDLKALLKNGGDALDEQTMIALCILVESVRYGKSVTVTAQIVGAIQKLRL